MESKKRKTEENGAPAEIAVEDARKMMEPFTREQLLEILQEAAAKHMDVLEQVRAIADKDPSQRKLFVRGLGWDTNTESLKSLFSQFGELEEGVVIMDKNTGKSKGYGFVTFKHMDGALNALKEPSKKIDGRMTVSQLASAGSQQTQPATDVSARKIYVGNVPMDMPADRLLSLFSQYGEIEEGPLGFDKQSGRSRGFALFIFKSVEATRRSLEEPTKTIDGHQLFCKLAAEGQKQKPGGINPGGPVAADGSEIGGLNQPGSGMPYNAMGHGFVNPGLGINQGSNPAALPAHQGLGHHGLGGSALSGLAGHPNPGGIPGGSMGHPVNPSSMNPGLSSHGGMHGTSNPVPSSLGMGAYGGHGGGLGPYGATQVGGYGGSQGAGGYGAMGAGSVYGGPPTSGPAQSGGFPDGGHYSLSYQNQHQQSGASPAPRVPGGGMYSGVQPFYPV
uniref:TSA: Wollemia nobilis Ref_Wollemi_Transcript_13014_2084 transcribed RNA sequence n=1 Tax=Wollemia nobilis TaxID=56998 RepID=A0A0C9S7P6_9CONI